MAFLQSFVIIFIVFFLIQKFILKQEEPDASDGAMVMAIGIFLFGAAHRFYLLSDMLRILLAAALLALAIFIAASFIKAGVQGTFRSQFIDRKIKSFAIGTWVAGTSVLGNVLLQTIPEFRDVIILLAIFNGGLWLFYLTIVVTRLKELCTTNLYRNAIGIILLSTVSTQSIAIFYYNVFNGQVPLLFSKFMIYLGVLFYIVGLIVIIRRYKAFSQWNVADDWHNTNCIIHGAMSITGLAAVTTGAMSDTFTLTVWLWVLCWFVIVEAIEVWRIVARVKRYGINRAIGVYDPTQWSRNFTFGMLYAFTLNFEIAQTRFSELTLLLSIRELILITGAWFVLLFLVNEFLLFLKGTVDWQAIFSKKRYTMGRE